MLEDVRVLEISAPETMLAGLILAELGADVVIVEPPGGASGRRLEPFLDNIPGIERSLTWHALNRNKRAITLDVTGPDGRDLVATLAAKFDLVLEVVAPGGAAPLDRLDLPARMIRCSISPFARTGPKSEYASTDMVVIAATGAPAMTGDPDRPPVFFPVPQAMMEAGAEAAIAALSALIARDRDGLGQRTEVSARIAGMMAAFMLPLQLSSGNRELSRTSTQASVAEVKIPGVFECADGYVSVPFAFGPAFGPMTQRLADWAADEGHLAARIGEINWSTFVADLAVKKSAPADLETLVEGVRSLCLSHTKAEIDQMSRKLGLLSSSIFSMKDVAESQQYRERGLWTQVRLGADGRKIDAPARFAQFSNFSIETTRPAPQLSEHTVEILGAEAGLSSMEIQALFVHGVI